MDRQRGSIVIYLLFSIAAAVATGYGTYRVMRTRRLESEAAEARAVANRPQRAHVAPAPRHSAPPPASEPGPDEAAFERAPDPAEAGAVDPPVLDDPTNDTVVYGTPGVSGGLSALSVERTVKRYAVRIDRCLRKTREQYRVRRGTVRVMVDVDAQGRVVAASAKLDGAEQVLGDCVLDVFRRLRFDAPSEGGPGRIVFPIVFAPAGGGDAGDPMPTPEPRDPEPL